MFGIVLAALPGPRADGRAAGMAYASMVSAPVPAPGDTDRPGDYPMAYDSATDEVLWDTHTIAPETDAPSTRAAAPIRLTGGSQRLPVQVPTAPPFEPPRA